MDQTPPSSPFGGPSPFYQDHRASAAEQEATKYKALYEAAIQNDMQRTAAAKAETENNREALRMVRSHIEHEKLDPENYDAISNILSWVGQ